MPDRIKLFGVCHLCGSQEVKQIAGYEDIVRVTSDCQPYVKGGSLGLCLSCGSAQKIVNDEWRYEISKIYDSYSIYESGGGAEQGVFTAVSEKPLPRSVQLVDYLFDNLTLPEQGRLLDIGCGNGAFLKAFAPHVSGWSLAGTELNNRYAGEVESIEQLEGFYICDPDVVPGKFDVISMIHVLEHIPGPVDFLTRMHAKLNNGGVMVIQVPDYTQNPFDLAIADHSTHFTEMTLRKVIIDSGFKVLLTAKDLIPREITLVTGASVSGLPSQGNNSVNVSIDTYNDLVMRVEWLERLAEKARSIPENKFGVLGTSIAAAFIWGEMSERIGFWVDEDPGRAGRLFRGLEVYLPRDIPRGSHVFIPMAAELAYSIKRRLERPGVVVHLPPLLYCEEDQ